MTRLLATMSLLLLSTTPGLAQDRLAFQAVPPLTSSAGAHDIARGVTVAHDLSGRTFEWDGTRWSVFASGGPNVLALSTFPPAPLVMAYDIARSRCMLFDGSTDTTWSWDGETWTQLASTGPGIRGGAAMVYDSTRDRMVLHGGQASTTGNFLRDTWEWDGTAWSLVAANSGPRTAQHGMAFDVATGEVVLFGGVSGLLGMTPRQATWTFDGTSWTRVATTGPTQTRAQLAYDLVRGTTVAATPSSGGGPAEIWEWDRTSWTQVGTASPLTTSAASLLVYETVRNVTLGAGNGETFTWNGASVTGRNTQAPPFPRDGIAEYDAVRQELVTLDKQNRVNETWVYDGSTWRVAAIGAPLDLPDPRLAYDPLRGVIVLMAESVNGQNLEVWEWDGVSWTMSGTANGASGTPPLRRDFDIAFDPNSGGVILFGGQGAGFQLLEDTWSWNGQGWSQLATTGPGRRYFRLTTDTRRSRVVLFGGETSNGQGRDETWEWDGQQWQLAAVGGPTPRAVHDMAYDPVRARVVMHGGDFSPRSTSTWEWDGRTWQELSIVGLPQLCRHAMFFDPQRQQVGVFAGRDCTTGSSFRHLAWIERQAFGAGCGPGATPTLSTEPARPTPGSLLRVNVDSLPPTATATWLGIGLEPLAPSIDLTPARLPGCGAYVQTQWLNLIPGAQGSATLPARLPRSPALTGLRLYAQAATLDPNAPGIGITTSNGVVVLVR